MSDIQYPPYTSFKMPPTMAVAMKYKSQRDRLLENAKNLTTRIEKQSNFSGELEDLKAIIQEIEQGSKE